MAQNPNDYDPFGLGLRPADIMSDDDPYGLGLRPADIPQQQPQGMDWWETGIRTIPAVAGGLIGGALGNIPGAMAGGALGSAIGDIGGQLYHGGEFNPYELGVETALGAVPPIFGAGKVAAPGITRVNRIWS